MPRPRSAPRPRLRRSRAAGGVGACAAIGTTRWHRASSHADRMPRFTALRYDGLDTVGHSYLSATQPRAFRDETDEERRRQLQAIDAYYAFIDGELDAAAGASRRPDDLLVVVSGFGMQPLDDDQAHLRAAVRQRELHRHPRARARRVPARLRRLGRARPPAARLDRRRRTDDPLFSRPARGPRHGRIRPRRSLHPRHSPKSGQSCSSRSRSQVQVRPGFRVLRVGYARAASRLGSAETRANRPESREPVC